MTNRCPYLPMYDGAKFHWGRSSSGERLGTCEASDLVRSARHGVSVHSRVWTDACDVGFIIISHRTGREVIFTLVERKTSREGETLLWRYESYGLEEKVSVAVYND